MEIILRVIFFSLIINWAFALQMLNQFSEDRNTKLISVTLSLVLSSMAGLIILV